MAVPCAERFNAAAKKKNAASRRNRIFRCTRIQWRFSRRFSNAKQRENDVAKHECAGRAREIIVCRGARYKLVSCERRQGSRRERSKISANYEETVDGRRTERTDCRPQPIVAQPLVELEPGGAGFVSAAFAARLAESLAQRRGRPPRSFRIRTARASAGAGLCRPRPWRAPRF